MLNSLLEKVGIDKQDSSLYKTYIIIRAVLLLFIFAIGIWSVVVNPLKIDNWLDCFLLTPYTIAVLGTSTFFNHQLSLGLGFCIVVFTISLISYQGSKRCSIFSVVTYTRKVVAISESKERNDLLIDVVSDKNVGVGRVFKFIVKMIYLTYIFRGLLVTPLLYISQCDLNYMLFSIIDLTTRDTTFILPSLVLLISLYRAIMVFKNYCDVKISLASLLINLFFMIAFAVSSFFSASLSYYFLVSFLSATILSIINGGLNNVFKKIFKKTN